MKIEKKEVNGKLERQREVLRNNGQELVETQSKVADLEDRLIQTETQLINAKASWADSEHEKEIYKSKLHQADEVLQTQFVGGLEGLLLAHEDK